MGRKNKSNPLLLKIVRMEAADGKSSRIAGPYPDIVRNNAAFTKNNNMENICADEEELERFLVGIRDNLPATFRVKPDLTRKDIRRSEDLYHLHNFLINEANAGDISRQEAVHMVLPIVLDVKPADKVLDVFRSRL
ncbi:hypothetical protein DOY81_000731 [Sarcophaga bullata]|nr:hypothetical protein DOY81_000731 [Sarcophaga bullata]